MESQHVVVNTETLFEVVDASGGRLPVRVKLEFTTRDPFAIAFHFYTDGPMPVTWMMSRELLAEGLMTNAGEGDVRLSPSTNGETLMQLRSDAGAAEVCVPATTVAEFILSTYDVVALGDEGYWFDIDEELLRIITPAPEDH